MKNIKLSSIIFLFLGIFGLTSCNSDDEPSVEPVAVGNIVGSVNLYDEGVTPVDNANMKVSIEGFSPQMAAFTDSSGAYTLADVPFGNYTLTYEKEGFGTFKKFGISHTNTGVATVITQTPSLGEISTTEVTDLSVEIIANSIIISATTNPGGSIANRRYLRYFAATDANVSDENYAFYSSGFVAQVNPYQITLSGAALNDMGFASGQTVYLKVYGDSFWSNAYTDPELDRKIFPNLNMTSANAVSFVVP